MRPRGCERKRRRSGGPAPRRPESAPKPNKEVAMNYNGAAAGPIERVPYSSLTPEEFFDRYVATRTPVVLVGYVFRKIPFWGFLFLMLHPAVSRHPSVAQGWRGNQWSNDYLREKCAGAEPKVEIRSDLLDTFGQSREVLMPFSAVVDRLEAGDPLFYMTTQVSSELLLPGVCAILPKHCNHILMFCVRFGYRMRVAFV